MFHGKFDKKNQIWDGRDIPPVFNPHISLGNILLKSLALNRSRVAQVNITKITRKIAKLFYCNRS